MILCKSEQISDFGTAYSTDQEECPCDKTAVKLEVLVVSHLPALGSAWGDWCKGRCVQEPLVIDWRLPRSEKKEVSRKTC